MLLRHRSNTERIIIIFQGCYVQSYRYHSLLRCMLVFSVLALSPYSNSLFLYLCVSLSLSLCFIFVCLSICPFLFFCSLCSMFVQLGAICPVSRFASFNFSSSSNLYRPKIITLSLYSMSLLSTLSL